MDNDKTKNSIVSNEKPSHEITPSLNTREAYMDREENQDAPLPDDGPINEAELATFPKEQKTENPDLEAERENHLVNVKRSPVRDGRNIISTDNNPDRDGFM